MRDIYIKKYYSEYTEEQVKEWGFYNKEDMIDMEFKENILECSFDLTNFIRVAEDEEIEKMMYITSLISIKSSEILYDRGFSCKYKDLII